MPDLVKIAEIREPWIKATILTPDEYLGAILKLCQDRRDVQVDLNYVGKRAMVVYELPLNEVVFDFYDRLELQMGAVAIAARFAEGEGAFVDMPEDGVAHRRCLEMRRCRS